MFLFHQYPNRAADKRFDVPEVRCFAIVSRFNDQVRSSAGHLMFIEVSGVNMSSRVGNVNLVAF